VSGSEADVEQQASSVDPVSTSSRLGESERSAAFARGPEKIPPKVILWFVVVVVVLGVGGVVADHFFSGPAGSSTTETTTGNYPPALGTPTTTASSSQLPASLSAIMALTRIGARPAPAFTLTDQNGSAVSLDALRGKVVLLSFFDATCDDICPVLLRELSQADSDLGAQAARVVMLTVNTDPLSPGGVVRIPQLPAGDASPPAAWHFLAGTLSQLDVVWKAYDVTVEVSSATGLVAHNDVLYFIGTSGRLRFRATPFADESQTGTYSLPAGTETEWATGIAAEVRYLLRSGS
jgi:cytochrome oxidase Cu insertion factor (SCO1/SenC/PrrC family)